MENKYKCHLAIGQFEFIEKEVEGGTDEEFEKSITNLRSLIDKPIGVSEDKFLEMIDSFSDGKPAMLEDYENLNEEQMKIVQAIKRAYNRSPLAKERVVKR